MMSDTHTLKHSHSRTHTYTHIRTHTPTQTPTLTHTHSTNLPHTSHQHPTLFCRKRRRRNVSLATVSQHYLQSARSRCQQRRRTLLKPENVAPIHVDGGLVHFTYHYVYLGSIISSDLADDAECGARIAAAAGAFGCLRARIFGEPLFELRTKSAAHQALILNLLFCGSE